MIFSTTMHVHAQWETSRFFQSENKSGYAVTLETTEKYPLSTEDAKTVIDILAAYDWEENRKQPPIPIMQELSTWQSYHYYNYNYAVNITHPDKRKVTLMINSGGIKEDEFFISFSNGNHYGAFRFNGKQFESYRYNRYFSDDDIKIIKQLFVKHNVDFNSIPLKENETVQIKLGFRFYDVFYDLEIPTISMDTDQSKQFIRLYNSGWNNSATSGGGQPSPVLYLYTIDRIISYDQYGLFLPQYGFPCTDPADFTPLMLDFRETDKQMLADMVHDLLKGHDGEEERIIENQQMKINYQYKDGLLHGQVKKYTLDGKLTDEVIYDKGLPVHYIKYAAEGIKDKEIHFIPAEMTLTWTEYDAEGNVKDSGQSPYQITYDQYDEFRHFYKANK